MYTNLETALINELEPLAWDSEFLGFGVARLTAQALTEAGLEQLVARARAAGVHLLYVVAAPADARSNASARQAGAWLADQKVTFVQRVEPVAAAAGISPAIRSVTAVSTSLEHLALQSGGYSRFYLDKRFAPDVFPRLYRQWLHESLAHQLAREVLAYEGGTGATNQEPADIGLLTLGMKNNRADIGLLAVDAQVRGQNIGQQLVAAARQRTAAWGLAELQVVTQLANEPACGFYRRCGFWVGQVEHIYHLWL